VDEYRTTNLDREALRVIEQLVSEQVLQEKNAFLEQELYQRQHLIRSILVYVVVIVVVMAATAVALIVLHKMDRNCENWLQNKLVGKYVSV